MSDHERHYFQRMEALLSELAREIEASHQYWTTKGVKSPLPPNPLTPTQTRWLRNMFGDMISTHTAGPYVATESNDSGDMFGAEEPTGSGGQE